MYIEQAGCAVDALKYNAQAHRRSIRVGTSKRFLAVLFGLSFLAVPALAQPLLTSEPMTMRTMPWFGVEIPAASHAAQSAPGLTAISSAEPLEPGPLMNGASQWFLPALKHAMGASAPNSLAHRGARIWFGGEAAPQPQVFAAKSGEGEGESEGEAEGQSEGEGEVEGEPYYHAFQVPLSGGNFDPPSGSTGSGTAYFFFPPDTLAVSLILEHNVADATSVVARDPDGTVWLDFGNPASPVMANLTPYQSLMLLARTVIYLDITSATYPNGAIRGLLDPTPAEFTLCPLELTEDQVSPPSGATERATGHFTVDFATMTVALHIEHPFGDATAAHVHALDGTVTLNLGSGTSPIDYVLTPTETEAFFNNPDAYDAIDLHTTAYPNGAVRGQADCDPWDRVSYQCDILFDSNLVVPLPQGLDEQATGVITLASEGNLDFFILELEHGIANATALHMHGTPDGSGNGALLNTIGTGASPVRVIHTLTDAEAAEAGGYFDIHSTAWPDGALRSDSPGCDAVIFARSVDPASYNPGGTLDVTLTVDIRLDTPETSFSITEWLPFGWSLHSIVSGPASFPVHPSPCDTVLTFAWEPESYPATLVYRLNVPGFATGDVLLEGALALTLEGMGTVDIEEETLVTEGTPGTGNTCPYFRLDASCTGGHITIDPIHHYHEGYPWISAGTQVTVEAVPFSPDDEFLGFSGIVTGLDNPQTFSMYNHHGVSAAFSPLGHYTPGCTMPLEVTFEYNGSEPVSALGLTINIPDGWVFQSYELGIDGAVEIEPLAAPLTMPAYGETGTLEFAWHELPNFSLADAGFTVLIAVPGNVSGFQSFEYEASFGGDGSVMTTVRRARTLQESESVCRAEVHLLLEAELSGDGGEGEQLELLMRDSEGEAEGESEGEPASGPHYHSLDANNDWRLDLNEVLRLIQFFTAGGYSCDASSPDGYAPGSGDHGCTPHASDYHDGADWGIDLTELLRGIQFRNMCGYQEAAPGTTEDGFVPIGAVNGSCGPYIALLGDRVIVHSCNTDFQDPGVVAEDVLGNDLTAEVITTGILYTHFAGAYELTYEVTDQWGVAASTTRLVIVSCQNDISDWFLNHELLSGVRSALGLDPADPLLLNDVLGITDLRVPGRNIRNMSGIELLQSLRRLDAHNNLIEDIHYLSYIEGLEDVDLHHNEIEDLAPLAFCTNVEWLDLHGNRIRSVEALEGLGQLHTLNLHDNAIADIGPLAALTELDVLYLGRNQITNIAPLVQNAGLQGDGVAPDFTRWDRINLSFNPVSPTHNDFSALESRGVLVWRPDVAPAITAKGLPESSAQISLYYNQGTVTLDGFRVVPYAAERLETVPDGSPNSVRVTDGNYNTESVPIDFVLEEFLDESEEPGAEPVGGMITHDEALASVVAPVFNFVRKIEYIDENSHVHVLFTANNRNSGIGESADRAAISIDGPEDAIPISRVLIHGNPDLPDDRAFVIALLGDAFPLNELGEPNPPLGEYNGNFIAWSRAMADSMYYVLESEPFNEYRNFLKIYRLDFISRDNRPRSVSAPDNETALQVDHRRPRWPFDTALTLRVANHSGLGWDRYVAFSNGGGSGLASPGQMCYFSNFQGNRRGVGLHELGHAIGRLWDEYEFNHGPTSCPTTNCPGQPNPPNPYVYPCSTDNYAIGYANAVAAGHSELIGGMILWFPRIPTYEEIPWKHWLTNTCYQTGLCQHLGQERDSSLLCSYPTETCQCGEYIIGQPVPLPTCEPDGNVLADCGQIDGRAAWPEPWDEDAAIGLYEGSAYNWRGRYRPQLRCRMRSGNDTESGLDTRQFCKVCAEQLVLQLLHASGTILSVVPGDSLVEYTPDSGFATFEVSPISYTTAAHPIEITWYFDNSIVPRETGTIFSKSLSGVTGQHSVRARVKDATAWVHANNATPFSPRTGGSVLPQNAIMQEMTWVLVPDA
jgi:hypothetical protein